MNRIVDTIGSQTRARKVLYKSNSENDLECLPSAIHCARCWLVGLDEFHISNIPYDNIASKIGSKF